MSFLLLPSSPSVGSLVYRVLIYLLLGTIRAGPASCEPETEQHLKAR